MSFGLQYANELSPAESRPMVTCYLSTPVEGTVAEVALPEDDANRVTRVVLEGSLKSEASLPKDTQVVFYATCVRKNETGADCPMPAGIGSVALTDLMEAGAKNAPLDVTLRMPSADWLEKGKLRVTATGRDVKIDSRIRWETSSSDQYRRVGHQHQHQQQQPVEQTQEERERIEYINKVRPCCSFPVDYLTSGPGNPPLCLA